MKLRLTAPGWQTYTGQMGVIFFENGLSVGDVLPVDAVRVAGVIGAEWEDGRPANVSQIYLDNMQTEAAVMQDNREPEAPVVEIKSEVTQVTSPEVTYTEAQLAEIADNGGITALREIATPLGIKSNSIAAMIAAILKAAGAPKGE